MLCWYFLYGSFCFVVCFALSLLLSRKPLFFFKVCVMTFCIFYNIYPFFGLLNMRESLKVHRAEFLDDVNYPGILWRPLKYIWKIRYIQYRCSSFSFTVLNEKIKCVCWFNFALISIGSWILLITLKMATFISYL